MEFFEDLINNDNFGRLFSTSPRFAENFLSRYLGSLPEGVRKAGVERMKIGAGEDGVLNISIYDDARPIPRVKGELNSDYFNRVYEMTRSGFSRVREYSGNIYDSTQTGSASNKRLDALSELYGVDFRVSSVPVKDDGVADILEEHLGGKGFIKVDPDVATVVEVFPKGGQRALSRERTMDILGYDFDKDKRWGAIFNEAEAELTYGDGKRIQVAAFDPLEYMQADKKRFAQAKGYAQSIKDTVGKTPDEIIEEIANTTSDGSLIVSESSLTRTIKQMNADAESILENGRRYPRNSSQYRESVKNAQAIREKVSDIKKAVKQGRSFNTRILNADNVISGQTAAYIKGEAIAVSDKEFVDLMRIMRPGMARDDILNIDILTTTNNITKDARLRVGNGVKLGPDNRPLLSSMTLNPDPLPKTPMSNTLTTSTYGDIINVDGFLEQGLDVEIKRLTEEVKSGEATSGLRRLLQDLEATPLDGLTATETRRLEESKKFAKRAKTFFDNGGDLRTDPYMTDQLLNQIEQHYFRLRKGALRPGEKTKNYLFRGATVDALNGRFPMRGGTSAHLESGSVLRRDRGYPNGDGRLGIGRGRFTVRGIDAYEVNKAFGGFDFDDSFYTFYQYDAKTKRLMNFTLRDPNAMGEYFIFDADITNDKNIPEEIRYMYKRREQLMKKLERAKGSSGSGLQKKPLGTGKDNLTSIIDEINKLGDKLDAFYSGEEISVGSKTLVQDFIRTVDYEDMFDKGLPAPNGFEGSMDSFKAFQRYSLRRLDSSNALAVVDALKDERDAILRSKGTAGGLFRYRGAKFSEYNQLFEMKGDKEEAVESISKAISSGRFTGDELIAKLRYQAETGGTLGRAVNQYTMIDTFISTHLDYSGSGKVDSQIKNKLRELLKTHKMSRVDRETLIDAIVKDFDKETIGILEKDMPENMRKLGTIIKELNEFAQESNIIDQNTGEVFRAGLDPIQFQERLATDREQVSVLNQIFGGDESGFLLGETDSKAVQSRLFAAQLDARDSFAKVSEEISAQSRENLSELIGDNYTPAQYQKAQEIISDYEESTRVMRAQNADVGVWLDAARTGDTSILDAYSPAAIQRRTIGALEGATQSDVLAIGRVLLDSEGSLNVIGQSTPLSEFGDITMAEIFEMAKNEERVFERIRGAENFGDLSEMLQFNLETRSFYFKGEADSVISRVTRNEMIAGKLNEFANEVEAGRITSFQGLSDTVHRADRLRELSDIIRTSTAGETNTVRIPKQLGELNTAMRAAADATAEEVLQTGGKFSTRMKRLFASDLMNSKASRRGMAAVAAFAGVGIVHRLVTGDRTIDQANPYPLIPEGSHYENITQAMGFQQTPVSQNGSTSYKIRAWGNTDPLMLSEALQGVLPQGSTTIYQSNAYQGGGYNSSSPSVLSERLG